MSRKSRKPPNLNLTPQGSGNVTPIRERKRTNKKNSMVNMERYLDDQYAQWIGTPPSSFSQGSGMHRPKVREQLIKYLHFITIHLDITKAENVMFMNFLGISK